LKILVELRPALEGHAGIPQEARLLFRGIGQIEGLEVQGLIQSSDRFLAIGLPMPVGSPQPISANEQINRLSRVVVSLQPPAAHRRASLPGRVIGRLRRLVLPAALLVRSVLGMSQKLTWFDPDHFRDFIWRSLFAKSLPVDDLEQVARARFRLARAPYGLMHACGLLTLQIGRAIYPKLDTRGIDAMLVLTPYPATVSRGTTLVVRYFDAVPLLMPHTIINKARHQALHYQALRLNVASGAYFACCSDATRRDLLAVFPEVEARAVTIPCMVSHHYFPEESSPRRVPEILAKRLNVIGHPPRGLSQVDSASFPLALGSSVEYLLMVSTLEPRKNHTTLVDAWEQMRSATHRDLKLVLVGSLGWDHEAIVERMRIWIECGEVILLAGVPADELRLLYRHARATICPSYAEGFGYGGVEAMRCGGVVVASDIEVHREIYGDAAEYFNTYSASDAVGAISRVIDPREGGRREQLVAAGAKVAALYSPSCIVPLWEKFLAGLASR
jgi:glycosyltransferase involved in cell wall biosynthesis